MAPSAPHPAICASEEEPAEQVADAEEEEDDDRDDGRDQGHHREQFRSRAAPLHVGDGRIRAPARAAVWLSFVNPWLTKDNHGPGDRRRSEPAERGCPLSGYPGQRTTTPPRPAR